MGMMTAPGPSREAVLEQVGRLLAWEGFAKSKQLSRLIQFSVETALDGRAADLKEYVLGIEVFQRGRGYDPRTDAVVRVAAIRLRAKLQEYYSNQGILDPIIISFPKGGYAPLIETREHQTAADLTLLPGSRRWFRSGILARIVILSTLCAGVAAYLGSTRTWLRGRRENASIAVLPFESFSSDPEDEALSQGLSEDLINALTKVPEIRVVARTSAWHFKGRYPDIWEVGRRLGAGMVMEGSVRRLNGKFRVTVQLNSAADGFHLWTSVYDCEPGDLSDIQERIAASVAGILSARPIEPRLTPGVARRSIAYPLYLKGRYFVVTRGPDGIAKGIEFYRRAIAADHRFALAYAGLAESYLNLKVIGAALPDQSAAEAERLAKTALELDPTLAEPHLSVGKLRQSIWDWKGAKQEFERALQLNPGLARAHFLYGDLLVHMDDAARGLAEVREALSLDPLSPVMHANLGRTLYYRRSYDEAIAICSQGLELNPRFAELYSVAARAYAGKQQFATAIEFARKGAALAGEEGHNPNWMALLGYLLGAHGRRAEASEILYYLQRADQQQPNLPTLLARVYLGLGEKDLALTWMEKGYQARDPWLPVMLIEPRSDSLRADPRFQALVTKVGVGVK